MHFANADALTYLLVIPAMIAVLAGYWVWKQRLTKKLGHLPMIQVMTDERSARRQIASAVMVILGTALLIIALAQPQWGQTGRMVNRTGVDVVFALDMSKSMLARDISPSRLQAAKDEIATTLENLSGDRVGLVVFTAVSFAQSPLTTDYGALSFYMRKLQPEQMPFGGTSIGRALDDAADLLTGRGANDRGVDLDGERSEMKRADNQLIVLITDGEDHESNPRKTAERISSQGIHIVTVGFGSPDGERIPVYDEEGSIVGYKRNRDGEVVKTRLDEEMLNTLANASGGLYIPYEGENSVAYNLLDYIDRLEKSELESMMRQRYKERFYLFLIPGVLFLLIGFGLGDRRRPSKKRVGEGGDPPQVRALKEVAKASILVLIALSLTGCEDAFRSVVEPVERGNRLVGEESYDEAIGAYKEAQKKLGPSPKLHFNIGRAHMGAEQWAEAQAAFARALESDDLDVRFDATYNLGLALAKQEKWSEAHGTFKDAISLYAANPTAVKTSQYDDAVHNMEVVWRKLFPPCVRLEDDKEDNDDADTAAQLEELSAQDLTLCGGDDDYYAIPVIPGTQVSVEATFEDLRDELDPEHRFLSQPEELQIDLVDAAGDRVLVVDQGQREDGSVPVEDLANGRHRTTRTIEKFTVTPAMLPQGASRVLLKVRASEPLEFSYDLDITAIPPCEAIDDEYEDNDTRDAAAPLEPGQAQMHTCPGDDDWFAVDADLGDTFFVDVQPAEDIEREKPPKLQFEIFDPAGALVATSTPEGQLLTAGVWEVTQPGTYTIRVAGENDDQQGPYTMELHQYAPCPLGDDRYEENDTAADAAKLERKAPMHRYLRICPEDADFYTIATVEPPAPQQGGQPTPPSQKQGDDPPERKLALGLSVVQPPKGVGVPEAERRLNFDLLSASGDQILLEGINPALAPDAEQEDEKKSEEDEEPDTPALDRVLQTKEIDTDQALVRVQGTQMFYHLVQLDPSAQQQQQDQQQQDQENEDQQQKQDQQQDGDGEEQKPKDSEDEGDKGEEGEEESQSQKQDQGDESDEQGEGAPKEQPEQDKPGEAPSPQEQAEEQAKQERKAGESGQNPEMQRIEDILRALEDSDDNFQMRKALENTPGRYIEKDW